MTTMTKAQATEKQVAFVNKLVFERTDHVAGEDAEKLSSIITMLEWMQEEKVPMTKLHASNLIDLLLAMQLVRTSKPLAETVDCTKAKATIPYGTYTVVLNNDENDYVTLRVEKASFIKDSDKTMVSYLGGSDNENSYRGFAFIGYNGINVWSKFQHNTRIVTAAKVLWAIAQDEAGLGQAHEEFLKKAEAYALSSGHCARCNRKLTVPASLHRGLGPECAIKEGL